jgi:hypothetical protein
VADPNYQTGHYYLGLTLGRMGRTEESQREMEIAKNLVEAENKKATRHRQLSEPASDPKRQNQ